MARLSRDKKRDQQHAAAPAAPAAASIDVHVPASGTGAGAAWVDGVRIVAAPGEEVQQTVLTHLHHIASSTGHAVLATIHDERIGYVVPLQVDPDGASRFTADPTALAPQVERESGAGGDSEGPGSGTQTPASASGAGGGEAGRPGGSGVPAPPAGPPASSDDLAAAAEPQPRRDLPTHLLRPVDEPVRDAVPTFRMRAVPEAEPGDAAVPGYSPEAAAGPEAPEGTATTAFPPAAGQLPPADEVPPTGVSPSAGYSPPTGYSPPAFPPHALPDPPTGHAPGTVVPPTGEFGPPPVMDARPEPAVEPAPPAPPVRRTPPVAPLLPDLGREPEPAPKPTPPRGFDAVAEAVLGDDPMTALGDGTTPPLLAEPLARINEAVKAGRTDTAAELADRTLTQASGTLGPDHPEVLHLRELASYIAYLAGDPVRSLQLSLDLAQVRHHMRDAEAAYGNIQSAFTAWRAVRDPLVGLELGQALIGLWTELTAEDGPAADDIEQLDKARARMGRLTERAQGAR